MALEGLNIDQENPAFFQAATDVAHGKNVFLTGEAGTGKTTFLHYIVKFLKEELERNVVVVAPTGVAAVNAGGRTIHGFFRLPLRPLLTTDPVFSWPQEGAAKDQPNIFNSFRYTREHLDVLEEMETLVIDEVSMVRCDVLQALDRLLRVFRKRHHEPFGGVQVVLIGDAFQLPPVVPASEEFILNTEFPTRFFFGTKAFQEGNFQAHILTKLYRQTDPEFISLLNRVRQGTTTVADVSKLHARMQLPIDRTGYIHLVTHRKIALEINERHLAQIHEPLHTFEATITGDFPRSLYPMAATVELKEGAQVIALRNDWRKGIYNGMTGVVKEIGNCRIRVNFQTKSGDRLIDIETVTWENNEYSIKDGKVVTEVKGTFSQFPLALAWAITVHKSQGLTFDKVIVDLVGSFDFGQEYVALSRCTSMDHLFLRSRIRPERMGPHPRVNQFYARVFGAA